MKRLSVIMGIIAMVLVAIPSHGADIIFKVPVELVNLSPEVKKVQVVCMVFPASLHSSSIGHGFEQIVVNKGESGVGSLIRPVSNPVIVEVNMEGGHHISEAGRYSCEFSLMGDSLVVPKLPNRASQGHPIWAQADPTKPFVRIVRGTLPWARTR